MNNQSSCACGGAPKLIFACSGASDVGAITDQAARKLTREGVGKMYCTAGIGGRVSGILATTQSAACILALDGCPLNCARKTLEQAGFQSFEHVQLADLGMGKGQTPPAPEAIARVALAVAEKLKEKERGKGNDV